MINKHLKQLFSALYWNLYE